MVIRDIREKGKEGRREDEREGEIGDRRVFIDFLLEDGNMGIWNNNFL